MPFSVNEAHHFPAHAEDAARCPRNLFPEQLQFADDDDDNDDDEKEEQGEGGVSGHRLAHPGDERVSELLSHFRPTWLQSRARFVWGLDAKSGSSSDEDNEDGVVIIRRGISHPRKGRRL